MQRPRAWGCASLCVTGSKHMHIGRASAIASCMQPVLRFWRISAKNTLQHLSWHSTLVWTAAVMTSRCVRHSVAQLSLLLWGDCRALSRSGHGLGQTLCNALRSLPATPAVAAAPSHATRRAPTSPHTCDCSSAERSLADPHSVLDSSITQRSLLLSPATLPAFPVAVASRWPHFRTCRSIRL